MATLEAIAPPQVARPRYITRLLKGAPVVPGLILLALAGTAIFANIIAPYDPMLPIPGAKVFQPPAWMPGGHVSALLGTDFQGRDVLSRLIFGARVSLLVGDRKSTRLN